jgi:hypothetical protein
MNCYAFLEQINNIRPGLLQIKNHQVATNMYTMVAQNNLATHTEVFPQTKLYASNPDTRRINHSFDILYTVLLSFIQMKKSLRDRSICQSYIKGLAMSQKVFARKVQ